MTYRIAAQSRLFLSGAMGDAVTVWSSYEGGYGPTQLRYTEDQPVVIRREADDADDQLQFAGGYICGWTESVGGEPNKLDIWLEEHKPS